MALADLDEILVRATFSSMPVAASIGAVSLEVARPGPSQGPRALEVEECRCPPGYVGLSCQVSVASLTPALAQPFNAEGSPLERGGGTSLGLEQGYQWEPGPRKMPLPVGSEMHGAGGEKGSPTGREGQWGWDRSCRLERIQEYLKGWPEMELQGDRAPILRHTAGSQVAFDE